MTNVGTAHIEGFSDGQAGIARAKFELVASLPRMASPFSTATTHMSPSSAAILWGRLFTLAQAHAPIRNCSRRVKTCTDFMSNSAPANAWARFTLNLLGAHNASNALAGLAVALEAGVEMDDAVAALESLTAGDKRGQVIEIDGVTILNDSYNSNPEALRSMIQTLASRPAGRRILVAGEMLELGERGPALHAACGRAAAEAGLDLVAGVQGNAVHLAAASCSAGVGSLFLPSAEAAGQWLASTIRPGDVVLVKGSRGVHLERAIEAVTTRIAAVEGE